MQVKDVNKHRRSTAVLAVCCFVLQVAIAPNIGLGGGRANFAMLFCGVYAMYVGGRAGVIAGFCSGLVFDLVSTGPFGLMSALLTIFAYGLGRETRNRFADGLVATLSTYGIGSLTTTLAYNIAMLLVGESPNLFDLLFLRTLPSFALSFLFFLLVAYYLVQRSAKGNGIGSGTKGSLGKRGSHYDVRGI
ncbi:MAG: rod shape-determining protein MreD [Coriobacteriales bacterium]|nr:rod shape-determining protein MreD [Coriobacteriales bacterium]